jgi:Tripartite tricarboxylate transporter TctB family
MRIRNQRDFWSGLMFIAAGILFIALSAQYQFGTSAKMGPGYFPAVLGGLMAVLGALVTFGAYSETNIVTTLSKVGWREILLLLGSVAVFGFLLPRLGMVISLAVLVGVSAIASHEFSVRDTLIAVVVLVPMSWVVFVWGLELQFPVWPTFLTK